MASCDDVFGFGDEDNHHPSHHPAHPHPHPQHQPFAHRFPSGKPQNPSPSVNTVPLNGSKKPIGAEDPDDTDEYSDTAFCSQADAKCPPTFHEVNNNLFVPEDDGNNTIFSADDDSSAADQKSRVVMGRNNNEKRKDRGDDLSDSGGGNGAGAAGGSSSYFCNKKPKGNQVPAHTSGDYRKDREEWSDTAIGCLLDAYTEKYEQLNRGNLRGRDWEEVASIVSDRSDKQKSGKSVEQCKNKVDNLKKRYKAERHRLSNGSLSVSHWPWFKKMEQIVGSSPSSKVVSDEDKPVAGGSSSVTRQIKRYPIASPNNVGLTSNMRSKSSNLRWHRVVFKITGAALAGNSPQNVDPKVTTLIAREVATANRLGVEVAIVVGGSNFFRGDQWVNATGLDRSTACQIGMMATVMNSILLQASLEKLGVQTRVQTAFTMQEIAEPYIRRRAIRHLEKGRVVIFAGIGAGTGNPLFTTDTAAVLRASERSNMDGLYDCHSRSNNNGSSEHISYREFVARGLNSSIDMTAIQFCEENNIPVVMFDLFEPGNISRALCGDQVGTLIDQSGRIS
ncbi:uncharacterized protein [Aristolochia californica]|uniref:uncharacterized protein isoform X2 n=1 Tax=Aristolochia californica TaxID=171875 RepID=UPI0035E13E6E